MKAVHFSKTTKRLFMAVALSGVLTACGGDKPAETPKPAPEQATKPVQTTEAKTAPSEEVPKQTVENENKTRGYPTDNDHTKPLAAPQEGKPEPKPEADTAPKAEVKALSLEEGKKRYETTCKVCHDQGLRVCQLALLWIKPTQGFFAHRPLYHCDQCGFAIYQIQKCF